MGGGGGGGEGKNDIGTKKLQKSHFDVAGLCCSSEVSLIERILRPLEGVKDVSVIVTSRTVIVLHDDLLISQLQIVKVLNQAKLEANVRVYGGASFQKKWPSPYAIVCGVLLLLSLLKFVYRPFQWLALGSVAVGIFPILLKSLASIRNWSIDSNCLMLITVIGSVALKDYWEAASIVFLFTIAQWLEARASHKATAVMSSLMNIVPQKAVLAENGEEVAVDTVKVNTIIAVKAGEIIPIDGVVVEGRCEVDEKTLTGESFPVAKQIDSNVLAGTINLNGYVSVRTTALPEDCVVARMAQLVEEAQNNKSKTQRFIDKCAKVYTPVVIILSGGLALVPVILRLHNLRHWFHLALVVLVSACPCALILSTPVATFCALSKAATSGLLIKGGEYLETLAKIKIMAFDKTGTITRGEFVVTDFHSVSDDVTLNTLIYWVSSIESKSSHPMAAALIDYASTLSIEPKPERVEEFDNFPGEGIHGKIDGKDVYVGNKRIALRAGSATAPSIEGLGSEGKSIGYIFLGSAPAGIFSLSDSCRSGVKEAINELKSMNIKTAMLTGDSHEAAMLAQNQLADALDVVHAGLLPKDKAEIISNFQKEAPTAMVGDGMNDAPALATADIGISMGISGSALATETGNVILMSNDIRKIPKVIQLARKTKWKVIQNVFISILTKTAVIGLAIAGHPLVWAAVLADVGTCLVVIFNSMLLLKGNGKGNGKHAKCYKSSSLAAHGSNSQGKIFGEAQKKFGPQKCCSTRCDEKKTSNLPPAHESNFQGKNLGEAQKNFGPQKCCSTRCDEKKTSNSPPAHESNSQGKNFGEAQKKFGPQKCCSTGCDEKKTSNSPPAHGSNSQGKNFGEAQKSSGPQKCCSTRCDEKKTSNSPPAHGSNSQGKNFGEAQKSSGPQKCCSTRCDEKKTSNSPPAHGSNSQGKNFGEAQKSSGPQKCCSTRCDKKKTSNSEHMDHGSSEIDSPCMAANEIHKHGCEEKDCTNIVGRSHTICISGDENHKHGGEHCDHEHNKDDNQPKHSHLNQSSCGLAQTITTDGHCHLIHCTKNSVQDHDVDCKTPNVAATGCHQTDNEACFEGNRHIEENCSGLHPTTDALLESNHMGCAATKACPSLENRQISGCCSSFRKECCGKTGHFGSSFSGGLSEIIIE